MAYLESSNGLPPGSYTPEFLEVDAESGPWLVKSQRTSPAMKPGLSRWDLDYTEGVLWLGDEKQNRVVAALQVLATYSPDDKQFLWAWANQNLQEHAESVGQLREAYPEITEFSEPLVTCHEIRAWTLAAAAAYKLKAEVCYRLPGELQIFVALFEVTELEPSDPRRIRPTQDPRKAAEALKAFAGPTAMAIGGILIVGLKNNDMDPAIQALYRFSDSLGELSETPVGKGTPAADEALELSARIRQEIIQLSYPPEHPALLEGVSKVLSFLEEVARKYDSWPEESTPK